MSSARGRNPFGDDDDGDYKFGNKGGSGDGRNSGEDELKRIQAQIGHVENESLSSTQRALRALNEAEEVGTKTAAELVAQGEKLQRIEDTMDGVNDKLNSTQKNLNQLKGFFGGFKAKFQRNKDGSKSYQNIGKAAAEKDNKGGVHSSASQNSLQQQQQQQQQQTAKPQFATITGSDREVEINKNLDLMSDGLGRLKMLGLDMQKELDRQDPLIGRLTAKTDATHSRIEGQNTQMKKILK